MDPSVASRRVDREMPEQIGDEMCIRDRQNTAVKRHPRTHLLELCLALLLAAGSLAGARDRGVPPSEGIGNFGKVNDGLYRGAQPDACLLYTS